MYTYRTTKTVLFVPVPSLAFFILGCDFGLCVTNGFIVIRLSHILPGVLSQHFEQFEG